MYCTKCGALNPDASSICSACGASLENVKETKVQSEIPVSQVYQGNQATQGNQGYQGNPGYNNRTNRPIPTVPNNLVLSIVVLVISVLTCFCYCITTVSVILSIIAVVLASQVNNKEFAGDIIGAEKSAKTAKILTFVSIGMLVFVIIIVVILVAAGVTSGFFSSLNY